LQLRLFGRSRPVTLYKRRHHNDASLALQEGKVDNQFHVTKSPYVAERAGLETFRNTVL